MDSEIKKLLILQEEDGKRIEAERQLAALPKDKLALESIIKQERDLQQTEQARLKSLEIRRGAMRTERLAAEDQIVKYKTQQMQVKKNEEYTALGHEIDRLVQKASQREDEEIAVLLEIDTLAESVKKLVADSLVRIQESEKQIKALKSKEESLRQELKSLENSVTALSKAIKPKYLRTYENVKLRYKRPPFVIPIIDRKAQGLRVSGEVESAARVALDVVTDENSGRIVYYP